MEEQVLLNSESLERKEIVSKKKFIILSILTLNLYNAWWIYKSWRFFQERESSDIHAALRTVFSIFYLYSLLKRIKQFAALNGGGKSYSPGWLFTAILAVAFLSYLPEPYYLIGLSSFVLYTLPVDELNFAIKESNEYDWFERTGFSTRQTVLVVLGSIFWFLLLVGLVLGEY